MLQNNILAISAALTGVALVIGCATFAWQHERPRHEIQWVQQCRSDYDCFKECRVTYPNHGCRGYGYKESFEDMLIEEAGAACDAVNAAHPHSPLGCYDQCSNNPQGLDAECDLVLNIAEF